MNPEGLSLRRTATGIRIELRVVPRSPRNQIAGVREGRLLVRVTAPPVDSAANQSVVALLAQTLGRPKRDVRIVAGETSRNKSVEIAGAAVREIEKLLIGGS